MKIVIASNNKNKIKEFKKIFEDTKFELISMEEIGFNEDIEETGTTFKENALIKAKTISEKFNVISIADDSGLEVEALNKEPGIYSARYAGENKNDDDNNKKLISKMIGITNRSARYVCAICFYMPNGKYIITEDTCNGYIIEEPKGNNGFGYDPHFMIPTFNKTMAEITIEEKNTISHRSKALEKLKSEYVEIIDC